MESIEALNIAIAATNTELWRKVPMLNSDAQAKKRARLLAAIDTLRALRDHIADTAERKAN